MIIYICIKFIDVSSPHSRNVAHCKVVLKEMPNHPLTAYFKLTGKLLFGSANSFWNLYYFYLVMKCIFSLHTLKVVINNFFSSLHNLLALILSELFSVVLQLILNMPHSKHSSPISTCIVIESSPWLVVVTVNHLLSPLMSTWFQFCSVATIFVHATPPYSVSFSISVWLALFYICHLLHCTSTVRPVYYNVLTGIFKYSIVCWAAK